MREIFIKTTTSTNHKRKNLCITEIINQEGFSARAEKKYSYYVSERNPIQDPVEMNMWLSAQNDQYHKKNRHVSIRKIYDTKTGVGQMIYRVIGSFYVIQNLHIFAVVFMHSIKFDMLSGHLPQPKV